MNKLKTGIIGLGKMGHIRAEIVQKHSAFEMCATCDVKEDNKLDYPKVPFFSDYHELLKQDIDAVFVCTTNLYIPEIVINALNNGIHVFSEKPPGRNLNDVILMQQAETANPNIKLKFGFNHRYHQAIKDAKSIADSGELGKIMWIRGVYGKAGGHDYDKAWRNQPKISGGGILIDQGIHLLDLMLMFCHDFNDIHSFITQSYWDILVEDNAFIIMKNAMNQVGMVHSSATQWWHRFLMEIYMEKGYLTIDGILSATGSYAPEKLKIARCSYDDENYPIPNPKEEVTVYKDDLSWKSEVNDFAWHIMVDTPVAIGSSSDAYKVMDLVQRIYHVDTNWIQHLEKQRRG